MDWNINTLYKAGAFTVLTDILESIKVHLIIL